MHLFDKIVGYVRVSTEKQNVEDRGLRGQAERIHRFCTVQSLTLLGTYEDVGSAAGIDSPSWRPGLQDATRLAEAEGATLIVTEPTRLFRNVEAARRWFQDLRCPVWSIKDAILLDEALLLDRVRVGQEEAEQRRIATSEAMQEKRASGTKLGAPSGHSKAGKASGLVRSERAALIRDAMMRVMEEDIMYRELPNRAFADLLNRRGIRSGHGRLWTASTVKQPRAEAKQWLLEKEAIEAEAPPVFENLIEKQQQGVPADLTQEEREMEEMKKNPMWGIL